MCPVSRRLLALALLVVAVPIAAAAAPVPAAPAKAEGPMAAVRKALDEVADMNYQGRSLNDVVNDLKDKTKVPVILDNLIFNFGFNPDMPIVNVNLRQVKIRDGLKAALAPYNLSFGLTRDGVFISTEEGVINRQMRQRVSVDCDGTELASALSQLANDTGANLILDPRLGQKAKQPITLKLDDVPLETAVRLLAEVADLRAVRMNNVLFVTTPERARILREDADGPTPVPPPIPFFPGGMDVIPFPGIGAPGFGVPGIGAPGAPGGVVPEQPEMVPAQPEGIPVRPGPVPVERAIPAERAVPAKPVAPPPPVEKD